MVQIGIQGKQPIRIMVQIGFFFFFFFFFLQFHPFEHLNTLAKRFITIPFILLPLTRGWVIDGLVTKKTNNGMYVSLRSSSNGLKCIKKEEEEERKKERKKEERKKESVKKTREKTMSSQPTKSNKHI